MRYDAVTAMLLNGFPFVPDCVVTLCNPCNSAPKNFSFRKFLQRREKFSEGKGKGEYPMKTKLARHISPAAIAIALFMAVALLTRGAPITVISTDSNRVDYYVGHSPTPARAGIHRE